MAIERTGSTITINIDYGSSYREGSQSISVPADADIAVASYFAYRTVDGWFNTPMFAIGSDNFTQRVAVNAHAADGQTVVIETLTDPDTGTQTFYWDYSDTDTPYYGGIVHIVFYKGVNTSDPIADTGSSPTGNDITGMSYETGDMMVGAAISFDTNIVVTASLQTQIVNPASYRWTRAALAEKLSASGFDTTGGLEMGVAAIVLKDAANQAYGITSELGIGDTIDGGAGLWDGQTETVGLSAAIGANVVRTAGIVAGIGLSDDVSGRVPIVAGITAGIGLNGTAGGQNLTAWVAANGDRIVYRYAATLTGAADGLADYALPGLKSIQTRMRDGSASYLGLTLVYSAAAAAAIAARSNGELVVEMIAVVDGAASLREELLRVDFDSLRYDRGASSQSISLTGYRTRSYSGGRVPLVGVVTETLLTDGRMQYRCAAPGFFLRPGDTVVYGDDEVRVDAVACMVSSAAQYMDVTGDIVAAGETPSWPAFMFTTRSIN